MFMGSRTTWASSSLGSKTGSWSALGHAPKMMRSTWTLATSRRSRWVMKPISMRFLPMLMPGLRLARA